MKMIIWKALELPQLSKKWSLKGSAASYNQKQRSKDNQSQDIWD